ncbi:MAG TPA: carbohydrate ABC transporter permease, partial [Candidatus Latescibacteria bacterium]|nr:carbohydrate ABC transporter permease [Candidatus Latescibacterota bacterium]
MLLRTVARTRGEKVLLSAFYTITVLWVSALLVPFAWMASSACKNRLDVYRMPPKWIPELPRVAMVVLDYGDDVPSEGKLVEDAAVAVWMTWDRYGRESVWGVEVVSVAGGKVVFECRAPSYKIKHLKDTKLIAAVLDEDMVRRHARDLVAGIEHRFSGRLEPKRNSFPDQAREIRKFLEGEGVPVESVVVGKSFRRLFDAFVSAWLYLYETANTRITFGRFLLNSSVVTGAVILSQLLISSLAAYALSRLLGPRLSRYLLLFFLATIMIPPLLLFMPLYLMMKNFLISHIPFTHISLPTINLLDPELPGRLHPLLREVLSSVLPYLPLVLPHMAWGLSVLLFKGFFNQLPDELIEAARLDGASEFRIFTHVVLPLSKPVFSVMTLWTFIAVWNEIMWPYIVSVVQP